MREFKVKKEFLRFLIREKNLSGDKALRILDMIEAKRKIHGFAKTGRIRFETVKVSDGINRKPGEYGVLGHRNYRDNKIIPLVREYI